MPKNHLYPPEGLCPPDAPTLAELREAAASAQVLEAPVLRCDASHRLHLQLGRIPAIMPREEVCAPWINGAEREISILSRVGKQICFTVKSITADEKGAPRVLLSRREAQEEAMAFFLKSLVPGDVLRCKVLRLETFGAFLDMGRGVVALLPLESLSVSRIPHPRARLREGQVLPAVVTQIDRKRRRITLSLRELLGTWLENAAAFSPGETVQGVVRSIKDYGSFIELAPNLSGLADTRAGVREGDRVSVYIKSLRPERMKIKLQIIEALGPETQPAPLHFQITDGHLDRWEYSPGNYERSPVETVFTETSP